tara:strand:+ start:965 stop:1204 length:240 start_codon:yes stop_codon:yes gene_type:complete
MIEIPTWILALLVFAIFILFVLLLETQQRITYLFKQSIVNADLTSQSFNEIAFDMDNINDTVRKLEAAHEYKKPFKANN